MEKLGTLDLAGLEMVSSGQEDDITWTRYTDGVDDYEVRWDVVRQEDVGRYRI